MKIKHGQIYYEIPTKSLIIIAYVTLEAFVGINDDEGEDLVTRSYLKEDCVYIGDL